MGGIGPIVGGPSLERIWRAGHDQRRSLVLVVCGRLSSSDELEWLLCSGGRRADEVVRAVRREGWDIGAQFSGRPWATDEYYN